MPFSFSANWKACKGSSKCPCANHLTPASLLESRFRDTANDDPTLHRVIYGNERATPVEENTVFGTIPGLESQLRKAEYRLRMLSRLQGALVAETQQVDNELKRVLEHRDALSRAIDVRRSKKAPIRAIPPEVLSHILSFTIDIPVKRRKVDDSEDPILSMPWSIEPREHQLNTFQLVCKRWRRDILGCPSLWSQILIIANPHGTHSNAFRPKYTHYLKRQISRAGKNKLDIYIALLGNEVFYMTHLSPIFCPCWSQFPRAYAVFTSHSEHP
ncbi:hypothetical protein CPB85DRAFT_1564081 [Mucidula mucida]|nr:hypothetical protein CPB85DRAFT_1564081 [Mucidula mucida]